LPQLSILLAGRVVPSPVSLTRLEILGSVLGYAGRVLAEEFSAHRIRRALYQEIARYRHAKNEAPRAEPRGFCLDLTGATCGQGVAATP
jgi:hypothetical protein